ncbi:MAG TPA: M1 family metallopeptidase, partial [Bacteroidota bacterium]|nr:M1 family metallopeptidase [Bacteroidota bacterium]
MMKTILLILICACSFLNAKEATRLSNGKPSSAYWQQRVDYAIEAELDPDAKLLKGKGTITYFNNSPDTLKSLVWHVYQNVFRRGAEMKKKSVNRHPSVTTDGMVIEKLIINGTAVTPRIDETVMETDLPQPLLPHSKTEISVEWNYHVPGNVSLRTGYVGRDFGMCLWYPQIAVYDDRGGWDRTQYLGNVEFYLEYGNWTAKLTLPAEYVVAATGTLQNASEVLTAEQHRRLTSLSPDSVTMIITPSESSIPADSVKGKKRTWIFSAENVRDFAWAASPDFVWDGTKTNDGVEIFAFYKAEDYRASIPVVIGDATNWDEGAKMAKHAIEFYSARYGKYLYPQATVVSGPVVGMEYPMMVFAADGDPISNMLELVIAHELGHEWYPMMIGS